MLPAFSSGVRPSASTPCTRQAGGFLNLDFAAVPCGPPAPFSFLVDFLSSQPVFFFAQNLKMTPSLVHPPLQVPTNFTPVSPLPDDVRAGRTICHDTTVLNSVGRPRRAPHFLFSAFGRYYRACFPTTIWSFWMTERCKLPKHSRVELFFSVQSGPFGLIGAPPFSIGVLVYNPVPPPLRLPRGSVPPNSRAFFFNCLQGFNLYGPVTSRKCVKNFLLSNGRRCLLGSKILN